LRERLRRLGPGLDLHPFLADFLRPCLHLERLDLRLERLDLRLERLDLRDFLGPGLRLHTLDPFLIPREHLRLRLELLRLDLRLRLRRLGPGLALHTLDPFLIPREHLRLRLERLERLEERLERLGPGLALQPFLKDFLRPYLHGLLDFLLLLNLGIFFIYT